MNKNKGSKRQNVGFGIQTDIDFGAEEPILLLRISNPRRLNVKVLGEVLMKYFRGGYKTLILSKQKGIQETLSLLDFLGQLQATYNTTQYLFLERKLIRDTELW